MAGINFSDNIQVKGRELHLQTHWIESGNQIVSTLFDGGRVLSKVVTHHTPSSEMDELREKIKDIHIENRESIALLYAISTRVKTVRHARSLHMLGRQFLKWNLLDEAISELEFAKQYDPEIEDIYLNLGEAFLKRGGYKEAREIHEKGISKFSNYADLWHQLGKVYLKEKAFEKAHQTFKKCIQLNNNYAEAYFFLCLCFLSMLEEKGENIEINKKQKTLQMAKNHLERTVHLSTRFRTPLIKNAIQRIEDGRIVDLFNQLEQTERDLPPYVDLHFHDVFYLEFMYGEKGRDIEMISRYVTRLEHVLNENPEYADIHNNLAIGYLIQCRALFQKALHHFQNAYEINPDFERAKNNYKLAKNDGKGLVILLRALLK